MFLMQSMEYKSSSLGLQLLITIYCICIVVSQNATNIKQQQQIYAVVFDAGSTGTRLHVFTFINQTNERNETEIKFKDERFHEIKPGIGYYFARPVEAGQSLIQLLNYSEAIIPANVRNETCLQLRATAGLRLLKSDETEAILNSVRDTFKRYNYKLKSNSVSMLDATAEGTNAWITINFLLGNLHSSTTEMETVAVIDLGGGSTQITFEAKQISLYSPQYIVNTKYMNRTIALYSHSYLGNGLRSARKAILRSVPSAEVNPSIIQHPCIPNAMNVNWTFEGITYYVTGSDSNDCLETVTAYVKANKIDKPSKFNEQTIYGISHYYEMAILVNAIDEQRKSGTIKVGDYLEYAKQICRQSFKSDSKIKLTGEQRALYLSRNSFICLDLTYITVLLNEAFGLNLDKQINVVKKINGVEASWALSVALHTLVSEDDDNKSENNNSIKRGVSKDTLTFITLLSFIYYLQSTNC